MKYFNEVKREYLPSLPIIFITFFNLFSGLPSLRNTSLILLRLKFIDLLNSLFLAS